MPPVDIFAQDTMSVSALDRLRCSSLQTTLLLTPFWTPVRGARNRIRLPRIHLQTTGRLQPAPPGSPPHFPLDRQHIASISFPMEAAPPYEAVLSNQPLPLMPCDLYKHQSEVAADQILSDFN
ncbi:hypothetical protein KUCAC02_032615 [Chaenocephalus aceratus]|nr:hypothetical protein KUCAC02_032615 [Chaenocephalus aceratus]